MDIIELLKAVLFGIVEGVTEWLPVSSTGHIILLEHYLPLRDEFYELFEIVIQLAAIMAVIVLFFHKLNPFSPKKDTVQKKDTLTLWYKVVIAVAPSAVLGLLIDKPLDDFLKATPILGTTLNVIVVSLALVAYGIAFLFVEKKVGGKCRFQSVSEITYRTALLIGAFQCLSIIPGTSRSGATILGALLLGVSRSAGAEFSFFLAIPTMLGASALKLLLFLKDGITATPTEWGILLVSCVVSFGVSLLVIRGLMEYVRKRSFAPFGIYRIVLGVFVLGLFAIFG